MSSKPSGDDTQLAVGVVLPPAAVVGGDDDVLDAHPEAAGQVDAGLDREAHAGLDAIGLALDHVRRLVGPESGAMPDAVDEVLAVAGVGDHLASGAVDPLAGDPGADGLEAGLLGLAHDLVDRALLVGRLADVDGASRVGAIAVLEAAEAARSPRSSRRPPLLPRPGARPRRRP